MKFALCALAVVFLHASAQQLPCNPNQACQYTDPFTGQTQWGTCQYMGTTWTCRGAGGPVGTNPCDGAEGGDECNLNGQIGTCEDPFGRGTLQCSVTPTGPPGGGPFNPCQGYVNPCNPVTRTGMWQPQGQQCVCVGGEPTTFCAVSQTPCNYMGGFNNGVCQQCSQGACVFCGPRPVGPQPNQCNGFTSQGNVCYVGGQQGVCDGNRCVIHVNDCHVNGAEGQRCDHLDDCEDGDDDECCWCRAGRCVPHTGLCHDNLSFSDGHCDDLGHCIIDVPLPSGPPIGPPGPSTMCSQWNLYSPCSGPACEDPTRMCCWCDASEDSPTGYDCVSNPSREGMICGGGFGGVQLTCGPSGCEDACGGICTKCQWCDPSAGACVDLPHSPSQPCEVTQQECYGGGEHYWGLPCQENPLWPTPPDFCYICGPTGCGYESGEACPAQECVYSDDCRTNAHHVDDCHDFECVEGHCMPVFKDCAICKDPFSGYWGACDAASDRCAVDGSFFAFGQMPPAGEPVTPDFCMREHGGLACFPWEGHECYPSFNGQRYHSTDCPMTAEYCACVEGMCMEDHPPQKPCFIHTDCHDPHHDSDCTTWECVEGFCAASHYMPPGEGAGPYEGPACKWEDPLLGSGLDGKCGAEGKCLPPRVPYHACATMDMPVPGGGGGGLLEKDDDPDSDREVLSAPEVAYTFEGVACVGGPENQWGGQWGYNPCPADGCCVCEAGQCVVPAEPHCGSECAPGTCIPDGPNRGSCMPGPVNYGFECTPADNPCNMGACDYDGTCRPTGPNPGAPCSHSSHNPCVEGGVCNDFGECEYMLGEGATCMYQRSDGSQAPGECLAVHGHEPICIEPGIDVCYGRPPVGTFPAIPPPLTCHAHCEICDSAARECVHNHAMWGCEAGVDVDPCDAVKLGAGATPEGGDCMYSPVPPRWGFGCEPMEGHSVCRCRNQRCTSEPEPTPCEGPADCNAWIGETCDMIAGECKRQAGGPGPGGQPGGGRPCTDNNQCIDNDGCTRDTCVWGGQGFVCENVRDTTQPTCPAGGGGGVAPFDNMPCGVASAGPPSCGAYYTTPPYGDYYRSIDPEMRYDCVCSNPGGSGTCQNCFDKFTGAPASSGPAGASPWGNFGAGVAVAGAAILGVGGGVMVYRKRKSKRDLRELASKAEPMHDTQPAAEMVPRDADQPHGFDPTAHRQSHQGLLQTESGGGYDLQQSRNPESKLVV